MVLSHQQVAQAVPRCDIMTPQQKAIRSNNKKFTWPDGGQSPFRGEKTPVATGCHRHPLAWRGQARVGPQWHLRAWRHATQAGSRLACSSGGQVHAATMRASSRRPAGVYQIGDV